jgi:hypothetical protein
MEHRGLRGACSGAGSGEKGELILNAISDRKESAQYLEEFITIINNAVLSMGEVRNDIDDTIVVAGALLSQLHEATSKAPTGALPDSRDEIEPSLFAELSTLQAAGKALAPKESTVMWALEKKGVQTKKGRSGLKALWPRCNLFC